MEHGHGLARGWRPYQACSIGAPIAQQTSEKLVRRRYFLAVTRLKSRRHRFVLHTQPLLDYAGFSFSLGVLTALFFFLVFRLLETMNPLESILVKLVG